MASSVLISSSNASQRLASKPKVAVRVCSSGCSLKNEDASSHVHSQAFFFKFFGGCPAGR
jgi:hypothetical protein